jgi:short subunit dehydrogenase-like uncharacterized protein
MAEINSRINRQYDVVVWGASGFTGKLVTEYLLGKYGTGGDLRWAIAGRDQAKLESICAELGIGANDLPIIISDSFDSDAMQRLTLDSKVVLSTVGPYAKLGSVLVEACVANGTHYCDLAGEVQWMRKMIDRFQADAGRSGAKIVHSCGFDSIPSDMGVWFLQREARKRHGEVCSEIKLLVKAMKGGASGGTFASMMNALEEGRRDRDIARILVDPYSLNPEGERSGPDGRDQTGIAFHEDSRAWTAPFVMGSINTRIVRRSNALLRYPYGRDFRYSEATMAGAGLSGWMKSAGMTAGLSGFMLVSSFDLGRSFLTTRVLPKPGEGPDKRQREEGFFNLILIGKLRDGSLMRTRVTGDRDPGYGSTSKMLGESAVCLARDELPSPGGFWTPASAMGDVLLERLVKNAGLTFELT